MATAEALAYVVFLDNEPIDEGRWPVVGHRPDPSSKFPEPTYYPPSAGLTPATQASTGAALDS